MRPVVIEMKLDLKCLNKTEREKIFYYFTECRWLCNYLISMSGDEFRSFDTHTRDIWSYDKEKNKVERHLEIPAKFIQSVYPKERKLDFYTSYDIWKHSAKHPEKGKRPKTPSSSIS